MQPRWGHLSHRTGVGLEGWTREALSRDTVFAYIPGSYPSFSSPIPFLLTWGRNREGFMRNITEWFELKDHYWWPPCIELSGRISGNCWNTTEISLNTNQRRLHSVSLPGQVPLKTPGSVSDTEIKGVRTAEKRKMQTMKEPNPSAESQHQEGQVLPGASTSQGRE